MKIAIVSKVGKCLGEFCGFFTFQKRTLSYTVNVKENQLNTLARSNFTKYKN